MLYNDYQLGVYTETSKSTLSETSPRASASSLVQAGMIGKRLLPSFKPLIPVTREIRDQLEALPAKTPLPPRSGSAPVIVISPDEVLATFKSLLRLRAPDYAGWTKELILPLLDDPLIVSALAILLRLIVNGFQDARFQELVTAGKTFITPKSSGKGFRPLSVRPLFLKAAETLILRRLSPALTNHFLGFPRVLQLGVGARGGVERAVHLIQAFIDIAQSDGGDSVVMEVDAATKVSRSSIFGQLALPQFSFLRTCCYGLLLNFCGLNKEASETSAS